MAQALEQQLTQSGISAMSFEERLALLVDREIHGRQDRRCARLLKTAKLKYPQAAIEDRDSRSTRGLQRSAVMSLALGEWVNAGHAVLITGATGVGKSWLDTLKNTDVLLLDDWGMAAMDSQTRADLLEIIDDRASHRATIITSQLPIEHWHEWIGDQTIADAMLDRLMQNHHRFTLTGESLRKKTTPLKAKADNKPSDV